MTSMFFLPFVSSSSSGLLRVSTSYCLKGTTYLPPSISYPDVLIPIASRRATKLFKEAYSEKVKGRSCPSTGSLHKRAMQRIKRLKSDEAVAICTHKLDSCVLYATSDTIGNQVCTVRK